MATPGDIPERYRYLLEVAPDGAIPDDPMDPVEAMRWYQAGSGEMPLKYSMQCGVSAQVRRFTQQFSAMQALHAPGRRMVEQETGPPPAPSPPPLTTTEEAPLPPEPPAPSLPVDVEVVVPLAPVLVLVLVVLDVGGGE